MSRAAIRRTLTSRGVEGKFLAVAIALASGVLSQGASGQSVRTPEVPLYHTFSVNPAQLSLFKAGPFSGTADVELGYSFNDNANTTNGTTNITGTGTVSLNQIFQNVDLDLAWVLSPLNQIEIQLGGQLQENFYSNGTNAVNLAILPGSQIRLQATVGNVLLAAYEQFAIVQDPVTDPTIAGQTNLNRLTNTLGMSATVPLSHAEAGLEFDYTYSTVLGGSGSTNALSRQQVATIPNSFHLGGTFGYEVAPSLLFGPEVNATYNSGADGNDFNTLSGGGFLRGHLTHLIDVDAGAGILLGEGRGVGKPEYYAYLSAHHQLSPILQALVGISRDVQFSAGQGVNLNNDFHVSVQLNASARWIISASPFLDFGDVITGTFPGRYTQYGASLDSTYFLSRHISVGINYRYVKRDGSGPGASYKQNLVGISMKYQF